MNNISSDSFEVWLLFIQSHWFVPSFILCGNYCSFLLEPILVWQNMWLLYSPESLIFLKGLRWYLPVAWISLNILLKQSLLHHKSHFGALSGKISSQRFILSICAYGSIYFFINAIPLYSVVFLLQVFRSLRSIINGLIGFFTSCNRHRLRYIHFISFICFQSNTPTLSCMLWSCKYVCFSVYFDGKCFQCKIFQQEKQMKRKVSGV